MQWVQDLWLWLDSIGQRNGIDMFVAVWLLILVAAAVLVVRLVRGGRY